MKLVLATASALVCALVYAVSARPARACDYGPPAAYAISADPRDDTPPSIPKARLVRVKRGHDVGEGCRGSVSSCDDLGSVEIELSARDDVSGGDVGFVLEFVGENRAEVSVLTDDPFSTYDDGRVWLRFTDDGEQDVRFTVSVRSVDRAGNLSEGAAELVVRDDGEETLRCGVSGTGAPGAWMPLLLLGLVARSRRIRRGEAR